ncbi:MAG: hypothetical protein WA124_12720, partial [Smithella sp.]
VNPADVPTKNKERTGKTDRIDCRKLARGLRNGEIKGIYVPSRVKVEDRSLVRTRQNDKFIDYYETINTCVGKIQKA